ncbi:MAG: DUF11 domain-containing protein, partial [Chloroflexi bacterium]
MPKSIASRWSRTRPRRASTCARTAMDSSGRRQACRANRAVRTRTPPAEPGGRAMQKKIVTSSLTVALLLALAISVALAQQATDIPWEVLSGGGAPSTGPGVTLNGTLGQPMIAPSSAAGLSLGAGYWYGDVQAAEVTDLAIEKQALAASVTAGEEPTYAITVTNLGPVAATGVEVLDLLPPGTRVVAMMADNTHSESEFCSLNGTCDLGMLPGRQSGTSL